LPRWTLERQIQIFEFDIFQGVIFDSDTDVWLKIEGDLGVLAR
jgi:hypothetical protein